MVCSTLVAQNYTQILQRIGGVQALEPFGKCPIPTKDNAVDEKGE